MSIHSKHWWFWCYNPLSNFECHNYIAKLESNCKGERFWSWYGRTYLDVPDTHHFRCLQCGLQCHLCFARLESNSDGEMFPSLFMSILANLFRTSWCPWIPFCFRWLWVSARLICPLLSVSKSSNNCWAWFWRAKDYKNIITHIKMFNSYLLICW